MIRNFLYLIGLMAMICSCRKSYTCDCVDKVGNLAKSSTVYAATKKIADKNCKDYEQTNITCKID